MSPSSRPPAFALGAIERLAGCSPCAKSKRAAVVFDTDAQVLWGSGFNTPPSPMRCDGSDACRRDCGKICIHAEQMAIRGAIENAPRHGRRPRDGVSTLAGLTMLHVKVVDGAVVPGGPPSCWQCSREVLEADLAGFWLYETTHKDWCPHIDRHVHDCPFCQGESCNWCEAADDSEPRSTTDEPLPDYSCNHDVLDRHHGMPTVGARWRFYTAVEFHEATLKNCGLHIGRLP